MEQTFDLPPDSGGELAALLERSGVDFARRGDQFQFRFSSGGCAWQTVCQCQDDRVLVYGVHPARVKDAGRALALCSQLNSQLVEGSLFLQEEHFVFRTSARLTEAFEAQSRIAGALEYNAAALSHWWERLTAEAQGLPFHP
ncbi:hypothetical protein [Intestinimonas butyriciproducens]|uniref:Uncharacterized protein n=1 Tax=Candidatus Intestinimonas merdavium TaxID=2838622 RepID=A0A9D2CEK7_9FIRM|nr:hypothetical protein [Intestinimonas butyriciproducens]MBM6976201.1 hypothetical protein [Intestinimonas butyriciproducens]HIY73589.1 hypothetical protein [Candidatus Intestinimonas merdavium]